MQGIYLVTISEIGNNILNWVQDKADFLLQFLPTSPFRRAIDGLGTIPYIQEINWFIPIDDAILILMYWGTAIGLYYAYMIILRWIKAID